MHIRGLVKDIVDHPEYRDEIMDFVKSKGGVDYAKARLQDYVDQAVMAIDILEDTMEKKSLVELAHFTAIRDN